MAVEQGCCSTEAAKIDTLPAGTAPVVAAAPVPVLVAVLDLPRPVDPASDVMHGGNCLPVKPPGAPTYLLVSTLRI
jgi:hypothetical protein